MKDRDKPNSDSALDTARALMMDFARRTGLVDEDVPAVRYLWTDAFAVCNFLELFRRIGDTSFKHLALRVIEQVHTTLGRHRSDDARRGWISGLDDKVAERHPTAGGLRIGKPLNERAASEPVDSTLEWERDGQYFHYLSKWMHALNQAARITDDVRYLRQALELAIVAHNRFTYLPADAAAQRMYWKMSIDLRRPLVASMGQHDPLDALVTYRELQTSTQQIGKHDELPRLAKEVNDARAMCTGQDWATTDPLGTGGLLFDACRVGQMRSANEAAGDDLDGEFLETLLRCAKKGLQAFTQSATLSEPADFRLAFRELGLSIGLHALAHMRALVDERWPRFRNGPELVRLLDEMQRFQRLGEAIETFWLDGVNRESASWNQHRDINTVMLASSLLPDGFFCLGRHDGKT